MASYFCPVCGQAVDGEPLFQILGQCVCHVCGAVADLTNVITDVVTAAEIEREYIREIEKETGGLPI